MIELRYNADGKLEYRTAISVDPHNNLYANYRYGKLQWDEWKIVPNVEKEDVAPIDNTLCTEQDETVGSELVKRLERFNAGLLSGEIKMPKGPPPGSDGFRTEQVTAHKWDEAITIIREDGYLGHFHLDTISALMIWADNEIERIAAERDSFERLFHSVNDAANEQYDKDLDKERARVAHLERANEVLQDACDLATDEWIKAKGRVTEQNKVIEELKEEKAEDWKAACESARIASGTVYDLRRKYEQVKKELDEIKNSYTPVAWGVRMPEAKLWRCSSEKQAKKCVEYFGKGEVVALFEKPQPVLTKKDIETFSLIADRLDYAQFYESANSLRSFIARNK